MQTKFGLRQIGIIILTVATAIIHLALAAQAYTQANDVMTSIMFTLNGLGYLALLAAYFLPIPIAKDNRGLVRWALLLFAVVTVVGWVAIGARNAIGYVDKLIEIVLIALLWFEGRK